MQNERISISTETLNKVLGLLANMPFQQVAGLIQEIQADAKPLDGPDIEEAEVS